MIKLKFKMILLLVVLFFLSFSLTLVVKGNRLLAANQLKEIPLERGINSQLRIKMRNFLLYSKLNKLFTAMADSKSIEIVEQAEQIVNDFLFDKYTKEILKGKQLKLIDDVGYKTGIAYLNLTGKIYKLNFVEQFFVVDSILRKLADIPSIKSVQFLVHGQKNKISPYINISNPLKTRKSKTKIAIIIDDFGNRAEGTDGMLQLKQKITCAIMPFKEKSTEEAEEAVNAGFDVIIHLPMEPNNNNPNWLGPNPILTNLSDLEIKARMKAAIKDIPQAVGFNNHTGGKATSDRRVMKLILKVAKENNLIAIDSRTSPKTVVREIAEELNVSVLERDVFLDHERNYSYIRKAILLLTGTAIQKGSAIGIGHVGPHGGNVTILALKNFLPRLNEVGIEFVGVSDLVNN